MLMDMAVVDMIGIISSLTSLLIAKQICSQWICQGSVNHRVKNSHQELKISITKVNPCNSWYNY